MSWVFSVWFYPMSWYIEILSLLRPVSWESISWSSKVRWEVWVLIWVIEWEMDEM